MAFTDDDRKMLIQTHTTVKLLKESHERRLQVLEDEDKILHTRINDTRKLFSRITALIISLSAAAGGILAYVKTKAGVQ